MIEQLERSTVGDIVAADYRAGGIFERFGIDFCCGGRRSLADACREASANESDVIRALSALSPHVDDDDAARWPLERLVDHIVTTHHEYVRSAIPTIGRFLDKLQQVHGARHPELSRVAAYFDALSGELLQHMMKEEQILFPYVHDLVDHERDGCGPIMSPFGSVQNPIRMMEREHEEAGDALRQIRELTSNYTAPEDGCTTYQVCMAELERFERDLHRHVHLENNVLFPRAIELEAGVSRR